MLYGKNNKKIGETQERTVKCTKCNSENIEIRFYELNQNFYRCMDCEYEFNIDVYFDELLKELDADRNVKQNPKKSEENHTLLNKVRDKKRINNEYPTVDDWI